MLEKFLSLVIYFFYKNIYNITILVIINLINMFIIIIVVVLILAMLRQINEFERGVVLTMGRFTGIKTPGWKIVVPVFQQMKKVDMRIKAVDVPDQKALTKDNVSVGVNAVIYYKIIDAGKSVLNVENVYYAILQLAQTTMRNVVGEITLDQLLADRAHVSERIQNVVETTCIEWGIDISNVELKDISLSHDMERTIGKVAEAQRERQATIIQSEGELLASENMAKAAAMLAQTPGALHLRTLQSINDMSSDQSNTVVYMVPVEVLKAFDGFAKKQ
jgi:regulator of protease activity HflC (stomatin/prohibitin superfamily)